jgi:hypothetical protein
VAEKVLYLKFIADPPHALFASGFGGASQPKGKRNEVLETSNKEILDLNMKGGVA